MKYTFLLPAYKGKYLAEMLRSIAAQTYADFKVIISDDCSPEDLMSICKPFLADPRFTYRRNEKNMGASSLVSHWNLLLSLCDTEFCVMASDDDVYEPTFLEEMDKLVVKYPQCDLFHARCYVIDGRGEILKKDAVYEEYVPQIEYLGFWGEKDHVECIANYIYRTTRLREVGGFVDLPLAWTSDTATDNLMSENGCASSDAILFKFRMSGYNISSVASDSRERMMLKMKSCLTFGKMVSKLINELEQKLPNSKLVAHQLQKARWAQNQVSYQSIIFYSRALPLPSLIRLIKESKRTGIVSSRYDVYRLFAKWLYERKFWMRK